MTLNAFGILKFSQGDYAQAQKLLEEVVALFREVGDQSGAASSLGNLGEVARLQGEYERAVELYGESLALFRELRHSDGLAHYTFTLASVALQQGTYEQAGQYLRDALGLFRDLEEKNDVAACLAGLAAVAGALGNVMRAARLWGASEGLIGGIGGIILPSDSAVYQPHLDAVRTQLDEATFEAAWSAGRAMTIEEAVEYGLSGTDVR